ncbi:MAG TPA: hypothetical protein VF791_02375 [Pyrinomonadaceae bacterium]
MRTQRLLALAVSCTLLILAAACSSYKNSTPIEAFQTVYYAIKKKDVAALKKVIQKSRLEVMQKRAEADKKNFDEMLKEDLSKGPPMPDSVPETRNVKIEGDRATLEYKMGEKWENAVFVKEEDGWKVARL